MPRRFSSLPDPNLVAFIRSKRGQQGGNATAAASEFKDKSQSVGKEGVEGAEEEHAGKYTLADSPLQEGEMETEETIGK